MEEQTAGKVKRIGVTTLSKLLSGDEVCHLKPWYEKMHPEEAPPTDGKLIQWQMNHTEVVTGIVHSLQGGEVKRETWLSSDNPPVIGKTDVVHELPGAVHIYEAKSGRRSGAHYLQLLIYIWITRRNMAGKDGTTITGHLVYPDQATVVNETEIPKNLEKKIEPHIQILLSPDRPRAVQCSACRFCWADCQYAQARDRAQKGVAQ
jgi:CRISPR-associated protein Cas4